MYSNMNMFSTGVDPNIAFPSSNVQNAIPSRHFLYQISPPYHIIFPPAFQGRERGTKTEPVSMRMDGSVSV